VPGMLTANTLVEIRQGMLYFRTEVGSRGA